MGLEAEAGEESLFIFCIHSLFYWNLGKKFSAVM